MLPARLLAENQISNIRNLLETENGGEQKQDFSSQSLSGSHQDRELQLTIVTPNAGETPKQAA